MERDDFFAHLNIQFDDALPFVVYRKPNENVITAFLQQEETLFETKDFTESGFVFAPFDLRSGKTVLIPSDYSSVLTLKKFDDEPQEENEDDGVNERFVNDGYEEHISLVAKAVQNISQGAMRKVVLSRKQNVPHSQTPPLKIFKRLLTRYATAFVYCWYHPKVGLWLGATPETLLCIANRRLQTMSLAGTQKFKGTTAVTWGAKEKEEQQFVTDAIQENLSLLVDNLNISKPLTHKAGDLLHLKSSIDATIDSTHIALSEIIEALHPTPAVCGLPRETAKQFILTNETYKRSYYTGFLGELNLKSERKRARTTRNTENQVYTAIKKSSRLFVNLRCMEIDAKGTQLFVGGGITEASNPEAEWQETCDKLSTMTAVLK